MSHAVAEHPQDTHSPMGLPMPNGKLAMWLFLVTEIMFFTGLIGVYLLLRNGQPNARYPWPTPHDVHLTEWVGALNTFVLICSSLTVVLAHLALGKRNVRRATIYLGVTLALGCVFLVIKGFEYKAKFDHHILPGHIPERLDDNLNGARFIRQVEKELKAVVEHPAHAGAETASVEAWEKYLEGAKAELKSAGEAKTKIDADLKLEVGKLQAAKAGKDKIDAAEKTAEGSKTAADAKAQTAVETQVKQLVKDHPDLAAAADSGRCSRNYRP